MNDINNIESGNWSMDVNNFGFVVENRAEINQTIGLILGTQKGTDPFRPLFGSDIWEYIDRPIDVAGPMMVNAIIQAIDRWEPRINLVSVSYELQSQEGQSPIIPAGIIFDIVWELIGGSEQEFLNISVTSSAPSTSGIIRILGTEDGKPLVTQNDNYILP